MGDDTPAPLHGMATVRKLFIKKRYIEIVGEITVWGRRELTLWDVFCIGEFTRENVSDWLANDTIKRGLLEDGFVDFHAVCGSQDIPWATQEARDIYNGQAMKRVDLAHLPQQLQEYYVDPRFITEGYRDSLWLGETQAVLQFFPLPPHKPWVDCWEKTSEGWAKVDKP